MNRKLNNTLAALTASGALLVVAVLFAAPAAPGAGYADADDIALAAEVGADVVAVAGALESAASIEAGIEANSPVPRATGTSQRRRFSTSAMPYFSIVPRG